MQAGRLPLIFEKRVGVRCIAAAFVLASIAAAGILAGCGLQWQLAPDTISLADRCAGIMKQAMPFAEIDIGERTSANVDLRTIVAKVSGRRTDMADNTQVDRDLAAECTFADGVLTGFRWTKGGPRSR